jgi:hypothetical protein
MRERLSTRPVTIREHVDELARTPTRTVLSAKELNCQSDDKVIDSRLPEALNSQCFSGQHSKVRMLPVWPTSFVFIWRVWSSHTTISFA